MASSQHARATWSILTSLASSLAANSLAPNMIDRGRLTVKNGFCKSRLLPRISIRQVDLGCLRALMLAACSLVAAGRAVSVEAQHSLYPKHPHGLRVRSTKATNLISLAAKEWTPYGYEELTDTDKLQDAREKEARAKDEEKEARDAHVIARDERVLRGPRVAVACCVRGDRDGCPCVTLSPRCRWDKWSRPANRL